MNEFLYDINSGLIAAFLLISMVIAIEAGYRTGLGRSESTNEATRTHINGILASILGILALLLGFTFSLSLQRFDSRSEAVVNEANAIGTAYLRAQLIPEPLRRDARLALRDYIDLRVQANTLTLVDRAERQALLAKAAGVQARLWDFARTGVEADQYVYPPVLFVESVNQLIDSFGTREAALNRHVPDLVLLLLYATFLMAGAILGFASGVAGHHPSLASHIMVALIVVLVFIILDLDRPRRGLIQVSQASLVDLQSSIHAEIGVDVRKP
jgi:hypothetical protein